MEKLRGFFNNVFSIDKPPWLWKYRSSMFMITATITLASFTDIFMYGVLVPLMPYELPRFGIEKDHIQKNTATLISLYSVANLIFSFPIGFAADQYDMSRLGLLFGLAALLSSTILFMFAKSFAVLCIARLISGASAAAVWVAGLGVIARNANKEKVGYHLGFVSTGLNIGTAGGPILGGLMYSSSKTRGWQNTFAMCLSFIAVDIVMRVFMLEKRNVTKWKNIEMQQSSFNSPIKYSLAEQDGTKELVDKAGAKLNVEHSVQIKKAKLSLILGVFKNKRAISAFYISFIIAVFYGIIDTTLPLQIEEWFNVTSLGTGLIYAALFIPIVLSGPFTGKLYDKIGGSLVAFLGVFPLVVTTALTYLPPIVAKTKSAQIGLLCLLFAFEGISLSLVLTPVFAELATGVFDSQRKNPELYAGISPVNISYSLFNICFTSGLFIGPFIGAAIRNKHEWKYICVMLCTLLLSTAPLIFFYIGGDGSLYNQIFRYKKLGYAPNKERHSDSTPLKFSDS